MKNGNLRIYSGLVVVILMVVLAFGGYSGVSVGVDVPSSASGTSYSQIQLQISNQSANQTQTTTGYQSRATVEFANQTTNGSAVTIRSATLPNGGFIVIHGPAYAKNGVISGSILAVSEYLEPGTYRNVTISFSKGVPGAIANTSTFSGAYAPITAVLYNDINGNHQFDYLESFGQYDSPYNNQMSKRVDDSARVVTQDQLDTRLQPTATVTFTNQTLTGRTLSIERAKLPDGGFIVVHNKSYLSSTGDPLKNAIGLSSYLSPGSHRNVTIKLLKGSVTESQMVVAVAYRDTNTNRKYDYIQSGGMSDYTYVNQSKSSIVTDTAYITVPESTSLTPSRSSPTSSDIATTTTSSSVDGMKINSQQTLTSTPHPSTNDGSDGGVLSNIPDWLITIVVLVIVAIVVWFVFWRR